MQWIVENFTNESSYLELVSAIKKSGHDLYQIQNQFKLIELDQFKNNNKPVIFCGSIEMTNIVTRELKDEFPVSYNTQANYLCTNYASHFGEYLFNDKYCFISLAELQRQKFYFYGNYGKEALIFIRPNSGQKSFQAQLLDLLDFDKFVNRNKHIQHDLVLVSTPKTILWEGRFVVSKYKEIIASSTYQFQGQRTLIPSVPIEATKMCKKLLEIGYFPDSVFVMDLCQDADGEFWLLELNSFSSAGLYECDKSKIVERVSEIAEVDWKSQIISVN